MGKSIGEIAPYVLGGAALIASGGTAAPALAGAAGAGTAAGAGAATAGGLGLAGNALAAQGAAGLLGGAGATAAGYGAAGSGLGSLAATEAATSALPEGIGTFGPNNEYIGNTIMNDGMSANSFTGGFDNMNGLERLGQRIGGMDFNGNGLKVAQKGLGMMQGGEQQQPMQGPAPITPMQRAPQQTSSFSESSNTPSLAELEEMKKREWLMGLGRANA